MITPVQKDEELLNDILTTAEDASPALRLWWLGQSGFLVQVQGRHLLFDPYLSDSLTRKYEGTDKPHVRMTELFISPERLDFIDVVTSSHNHTDHLDAETLLPLLRSNSDLPLVLPEANEMFARDRLQNTDVLFGGIDTGVTREVKGISFTGITAAHNEIDRDEQGRSRYLGFVATIGHWRIYHSGDTLWHEHLVEELRNVGPIDVMLLPINGNKPERHVAGNLNGTEAAALAKVCRASTVIPCHYDMFTFNTESPVEFESACSRLDQACKVLQCGEKLTIEASTGL